MGIQDQGTAHLKMGWWTRTFTLTGFRECSSLPLAENDQFDGHASHIGIQVIKLVIKNNINLLRSPSHTTHFLQPLDIGVYGPIRMAKILVEFSYSHIRKAITKEGFPALLKQIWLRGFTGRSVISGFKTTGIVPFNSSCIIAKSYEAASALSIGRTDTTHDGSNTQQHVHSICSNPRSISRWKNFLRY